MATRPKHDDAEPAPKNERSAEQDRTYDEVVRGADGVDLPPGRQDAMTEEVDADEGLGGDIDDRAAEDAANEVRQQDHSADRHADPGFRKKGG